MKYHLSEKNTFKIFRFIFGSYLLWHFYCLLDYGDELFSSNGMINDPNLNPTWSLWSSLSFMPTINIDILLNVCIISSLLLAVGIFQAFNSAILWCGWVSLFNRNNLIANPGLPYVGWLLLACIIIESPGFILDINSKLNGINSLTSWTFIGRKESEKRDNSQKIWKMPKLIFWSAWFLMASSYTISGIHKLQCESWVNGTALLHVLESLLARDNKLVSVLVYLMREYTWLNKFLTWSSLFLEISFLPLGTFDRLRFIYWISFLAMHIGILCLINFTDLTLGVLMIHFFTFDKSWINF